MKELKLVDIIERQGENKYTLLMVDPCNRALSITTGFTEAFAVIMAIKKAKSVRPATFNLLCNVIKEGGFKFIHTHIASVADNIFHANIRLDNNGKLFTLDCRPSDGIALALEHSSPIYINEELMNEFSYKVPPDISLTEGKQKGIDAIVNKFNKKDQENKRVLKNATRVFITEMTKEIVEFIN